MDRYEGLHPPLDAPIVSRVTTFGYDVCTYPTMISTRKKLPVSPNMETRRHFLPVYRPMATADCAADDGYLVVELQ